MDVVSCNSCGCGETLRLARFPLEQEHEESYLVRCPQCSLVYLNPRPAKDRIGYYYPATYQSDMLRLLAKGKTSRAARLGFEMVRRRRTPVLKDGGRVLDVGCSNGAYLNALREQGWEVEGIELDSEAAEYARSSRGLTVHQGDAESVLARIPGEQFDVVTMWHLLEHLFDPAAALANVHRILKPGGILMLEVPNFQCPLARVFGRYWFPLDIPRHLFHFTPSTLKSVLSRAGLEVRAIQGVPSPEAIVWSLSSVRSGAPFDFNKDSLKLNPLAMTVAFPVTWAMAQFRLSDHMSCVAVRTDAAPRKERLN